MCKLRRHASEVKDAPVIPIRVVRRTSRDSSPRLTWSDPFWLYGHCVWLRFLGAEHAEEEQKRADYNTAVCKHIAVAAVKRIRAPDLHRCFEGFLRIDRSRLNDSSERIDKSGNAGVGGTSERQVILDGTKHDH